MNDHFLKMDFKSSHEGSATQRSLNKERPSCLWAPSSLRPSLGGGTAGGRREGEPQALPRTRAARSDNSALAVSRAKDARYLIG